jgi:hypothetical protein
MWTVGKEGKERKRKWDRKEKGERGNRIKGKRDLKRGGRK